MRRKDREISALDDILDIIKKCSVCRVSFINEDYPYIVPMNFGLQSNGDQVFLYFHCANVGKKLDLLNRNNKVGFEMDCPGRFIEGDKACDATMTFESVCGNGSMEIVSNEEKINCLTLIMQHYSSKQKFEFDENELKAVTVLKLTVNELTGKRLKTE